MKVYYNIWLPKDDIIYYRFKNLLENEERFFEVIEAVKNTDIEKAKEFVKRYEYKQKTSRRFRFSIKQLKELMKKAKKSKSSLEAFVVAVALKDKEENLKSN